MSSSKNTINIGVTYSLEDDAKGLMKDLKNSKNIESYYDDHYISTLKSYKRTGNTVKICSYVKDLDDRDETTEWGSGGMKPGDEVNIMDWLAAFLSVDQEMHGTIVDKDNWLFQDGDDDAVRRAFKFTYEGETGNYSIIHTCIHRERNKDVED